MTERMLVKIALSIALASGLSSCASPTPSIELSLCLVDFGEGMPAVGEVAPTCAAGVSIQSNELLTEPLDDFVHVKFKISRPDQPVLRQFLAQNRNKHAALVHDGKVIANLAIVGDLSEEIGLVVPREEASALASLR